MKILSFDIEEWYIEKIYRGAEQWKYDAYSEMLDRVLARLDEHGVKATFFCLGELVEHFPDVVKKIAACGHEIGCHSLAHKWINKQTPEEFREETHRAVSLLEDCTGAKVKSFRAPAFSIGSVNTWAFDILAECGIENDASIFPGARDFGGFPTFGGGDRPCRITTGNSEINEFPITLTRLPLLNRNIAYSGGGYFRLLPSGFVRGVMRKVPYVMCYFHIADLVDFHSRMMSREEYERYFKVAGTPLRRTLRYLKANIGRKRAYAGLCRLLDDFDFISVAEASAKSTQFPTLKI